jgi:hypothetical protein
MNFQNNNYQLLLTKLDEFIRKFYVNQLIRGGLYAIGVILFLFTAFNIIEYFFYLPTSARKFMYYSFIGVSAISLYSWVLAPLMKYFKLGKQISHSQAANIIGDHFVNVKDKLLNILQLKNQADQKGENTELILASIHQKSNEIKLVPFQSAINLYQNKKYLRYALPPLLLLLLILVGAPSIITEGTNRLINNDKEFEKEAPFKFKIDTNQLKAVQNSNFDLTVKVDGNILPNEVDINFNNVQYKLKKVDKNTFSYTFNNVQKDIPFKLSSGEFASKTYTLDVLEKPNILNLEVKLDYPEYIGRPDESMMNNGDLTVPTGTNITWLFNTKYADRLDVQFNEKGINPSKQQGTDYFTFSKKIVTDEIYKLFVSNKQVKNADSMKYSITVIPDLYPSISVEKFDDSINKKRFYFVGDASDDYGLRSISFNYQIKKKNGSQQAIVKIPLQSPTSKQIQYTYNWNVQNLNMEQGDEVSYYFETFDNDGVKGSKSARTSLMTYAVPTEEQIEKQTQKNNDEIKDDLKKAIQESKKIQEEANKIKEKLLQQKELDWQAKKQIEKLNDRQKELEKTMEKTKENFMENQKMQNEFDKKSEEILKKQEQVQKMFEQLENQEMKDLMKQIEQLMQNLEKNQALEKMEDMKMNDEELQKELERLEEVFKQMEIESQMEDISKKLEELAEKQEKLAEDTEKKQGDKNELNKMQEDIKKSFDKLKEKLDEVEKKNKELDKPNDLPDTKEEQKDIDKDMKDSQDDMEQNQNSKASKKQKSAASKMKKMSSKMKSKMKENESDQAEEDMKTIRQLLENLVNLSFDQERVMKDFESTGETTPRYVKLTQQQSKLKNDFVMIEDSLHELSKRVYQIESFVTEKVTDIKQNLAESINMLEERIKYKAQENQQRTMKNVNDLALMLSETLDKMQQQQQQSDKPGKGSCDKPGGKGKGGKEPKDKISQGQKSLNDQLKKMKEGMAKEGGMPKPSKEFAQMAAKQAALRRAMQEKQKEMQQRGKGNKEMQEIIDQMDKVETELVNKKLNSETLNRQEQILTRLLEHENAEKEKKQDEERKAEIAVQELNNKIPPSVEEYIKKRQAETDMYKTSNPTLKPYYKQLVEDYFKTLKLK